jgi:hypothetical protein
VHGPLQDWWRADGRRRLREGSIQAPSLRSHLLPAIGNRLITDSRLIHSLSTMPGPTLCRWLGCGDRGECRRGGKAQGNRTMWAGRFVWSIRPWGRGWLLAAPEKDPPSHGADERRPPLFQVRASASSASPEPDEGYRKEATPFGDVASSAISRLRRSTRFTIHLQSQPRSWTSKSTWSFTQASHMRMQTRSAGTSVEAQNLQVVFGFIVSLLCDGCDVTRPAVRRASGKPRGRRPSALQGL